MHKWRPRPSYFFHSLHRQPPFLWLVLRVRWLAFESSLTDVREFVDWHLRVRWLASESLRPSSAVSPSIDSNVRLFGGVSSAACPWLAASCPHVRMPWERTVTPFLVKGCAYCLDQDFLFLGAEEKQKHKYLYCRDCRETCYCSEECQVADWPNHRLLCSRRTANEPRDPTSGGKSKARTPSSRAEPIFYP